MKKQIEVDDFCFCCGKNNEKGLQLSFSYPDKNSAETRLTIPNHFTGWKSVVHGGLLAMLLDEAMAHACISAEYFAVTAEMTIRYRNPTEVGESIRIFGKVKAVRSKIIETTGEISGSKGVIAEANARYLRVSRSSYTSGS